MKAVFAIVALSLVISTAFAATFSSNSASTKRSCRECTR